MTLQELAHKEDVLHSKTIDLYHKLQTTEIEEQLKAVFIEYKEVHRIYADFSAREIEALKRGLFIQWYSLIEPNYLTGISDLDEGAENKVIQNLNELISTYKTDNELNWMLNYYSNWDWVFKRHKSFQNFDTNIVNEQNNHLPEKIDKEEMKLRGQMGKYWNSLTKFNIA
ncbi:hypothetical protein EON73_00545 [bacterium]|nr:MAG: hypothetical protein EON73_00545 [bacterium]